MAVWLLANKDRIINRLSKICRGSEAFFALRRMAWGEEPSQGESVCEKKVFGQADYEVWSTSNSNKFRLRPLSGRSARRFGRHRRRRW